MSIIILSGILMMVIGNGSVIWAEQYIPSGLTALLIGFVPIWMVVFDWLLLTKKRPGKVTVFGICIGFIGLIPLAGLDKDILNASGFNSDFVIISMFILFAGAMAWSLGSILTRKIVRGVNFLYVLSIQLLAGGICFMILGLIRGEQTQFSLVDISLLSFASLIYLILFGTVLAYSAYAYLLGASNPAMVGTYALVNPLVAIFFGWLFVNEPVTIEMGFGVIFILLSIMIIQRQNYQQSKINKITSKEKCDMIARTWAGKVPLDKAESYLEILKKTGVEDSSSVAGNKGVYVFRKDSSDNTEFVFMSLWDNYDSIKKFAGEDYQKAKYYPEDKDYLLNFEEFVSHYEIVYNSNEK